MARILCISSTAFKFILCSFVVVSAPRAYGATAPRILTGTVLANDSGASGAGTGTVRIAVQRRIYMLWYQKPLTKEVMTGPCSQVGAIWKVGVILEDSVSGRIRTVACKGQNDVVVSAISTTARFLNFVAEKDFDAARSLLTSGSSLGADSPAFVVFAAQWDFSKYQLLAGGELCLEMLEPPTSQVATTVAGVACYLRYQGRLLKRVAFRLTREGVGWKLETIDIADFPPRPAN